MKAKEALIITLFFAIGALLVAIGILEYSGSDVSRRAAKLAIATVVLNQVVTFGLVMGWMCKVYEEE